MDFQHSLRGLVVGLCLALATAGLAQAEETTPPATNPPETSQGTPPSTGQATSTAATSEAKEDPIICKRMDAPTGSRMGARKVCRKASEWRAEEDAAKEAVDEAQSSGRAQNPSGN